MPLCLQLSSTIGMLCKLVLKETGDGGGVFVNGSFSYPILLISNPSHIRSFSYPILLISPARGGTPALESWGFGGLVLHVMGVYSTTYYHVAPHLLEEKNILMASWLIYSLRALYLWVVCKAEPCVSSSAPGSSGGKEDQVLGCPFGRNADEEAGDQTSPFRRAGNHYGQRERGGK